MASTLYSNLMKLVGSTAPPTVSPHDEGPGVQSLNAIDIGHHPAQNTFYAGLAAQNTMGPNQQAALGQLVGAGAYGSGAVQGAGGYLVTGGVGSFTTTTAVPSGPFTVHAPNATQVIFNGVAGYEVSPGIWMFTSPASGSYPAPSVSNKMDPAFSRTELDDAQSFIEELESV